MKKILMFLLSLFALTVSAQVEEPKPVVEGGELPLVLDDRFFNEMITDVMVINHLSQNITVQTFKAGEVSYDCGIKMIDLPPETPAYLNMHAARFLIPLTFEDAKGVMNLSYDKEFQAPYLAFNISFDGSYDPIKSRGVKWIFSLTKKEVHICATFKEAEKYNSETSMGVVFVPAPENAPLVKLQNESKYLIHILTPGLSFSGKTLDKNGGSVGMTISDREKSSKATNFYIVNVEIMSEMGERSIITELLIPVLEGATVVKITDKFFPEIVKDQGGQENMVAVSMVNASKYPITITGIANESGEASSINIPAGVTGEDIYITEKGFSQITIQATVNGKLVRTDILAQGVEDEIFQVFFKNNSFGIR